MPKRAHLLTLIAILSAVALVAACGDGSEPTRDSTATGSTPAAGSPVATTAPPTGKFSERVMAIKIPENVINGRKLGRDDAKVKIQMYEDFTCPHCLDFTATYEQYLIDTFVVPGTVQLEFRYFPLRQSSLSLMIAANCADKNGKFWPYAKKLFAVQAESTEGGQPLSVTYAMQALIQYGAELGMDSTAFEACLRDPNSLEAISTDLEAAKAVSVQGTPAFVVNGKLLPSPPTSRDEWKSIIEKAAK